VRGYLQGSGGAKDIHLENFSVSNGGRDLIENATLTMAWGRRYGLIGHNGAGGQAVSSAAAGAWRWRMP
jgi:ATP-binding cassette subfamily F protein 3